MSFILVILAMIVAYFIGSIPTGLWVGQGLRGIDIREHGSGNLGATNAFRVLGKKIGLAVLALDILKGLLPVAVLPSLIGRTGSVNTEVLVGLSTILGHVFSCFVSFKGGKGVATAIGVFLAIAWKQTLVLTVIGLGIVAATGYISAASVTCAVLLPLFLYPKDNTLLLLMAEVVAVMVIVRHRANILRLLTGKELKFWNAPKVADSGDDEAIPVASPKQDA
jgi:acyl phosphate:glycerol-3-phosphate acyltransferase